MELNVNSFLSIAALGMLLSAIGLQARNPKGASSVRQLVQGISNSNLPKEINRKFIKERVPGENFSIHFEDVDNYSQEVKEVFYNGFKEAVKNLGNQKKFIKNKDIYVYFSKMYELNELPKKAVEEFKVVPELEENVRLLIEEGKMNSIEAEKLPLRLRSWFNFYTRERENLASQGIFSVHSPKKLFIGIDPYRLSLLTSDMVREQAYQYALYGLLDYALDQGRSKRNDIPAYAGGGGKAAKAEEDVMRMLAGKESELSKYAEKFYTNPQGLKLENLALYDLLTILSIKYPRTRPIKQVRHIVDVLTRKDNN